LHELEGFKVVRPEIVVGYTRNVRNGLATVRRSRSPLTTELLGSVRRSAHAVHTHLTTRPDEATITMAAAGAATRVPAAA
jgi:hypothetical protein